jgi:hypothetical protein
MQYTLDALITVSIMKLDYEVIGTDQEIKRLQKFNNNTFQ